MEKKSVAFFERGSWYHRTKTLNKDGTVKYGKKGGFESEQDAVKAYKLAEKEFKQQQRKLMMEGKNRQEVMLKDYLIYWYEEVFSQRVENTTKMLGAYVLYDLVFPNMEQDIKLRYVSVEYMDALLEKLSHSCASAGNTCRTYLNIAFKDAVIEGYISRNPIPDTKPYKRKAPKVTIYSRDKLKIFLKAASKDDWYLEYLLGVFCGLRKGDADGKISLNQQKPSKHAGLRRFGPEKFLQRNNEFMKERPIFYKKPIKTEKDFSTWLRCFYYTTKAVITEYIYF